MTLGEWLDRWLENMANSIRPSTMKSYRRYADCYIKPHLGEKQISRITPVDVQNMYQELKEHGRIHEHPQLGHQLSDSMIHSIHAMLFGAMKAAERERVIFKNPLERVPVPKVTPKPKQILNDEQLERFLDEIKKDPVWHDFFYTELTTGLRRGEICGLQWQDFDEVKGTLSVRRTVHAEKGGELSTGDTKTGQGTRKILLPSSTAELLRERQKNALSQWIFPDPLKPEQPTRPSAAYNRMKALLKDADLPSIRFHDLRHTFATHALSSGVDAKTLSGILGHTKASFTLDTYTHVTTDMQKQAAKVVGNFLEDIFGEEVSQWQSAENPAAAAST
jgi:integrase